MNTIEILKTHNAWRRGDDTRTMDELGFSVTELGLAIDDAVLAIKERDQVRAELEECIRAWALTTSELAQERERVNALEAVLSDTREFIASDINCGPCGLGLVTIIDDALSAGEGGNA